MGNRREPAEGFEARDALDRILASRFLNTSPKLEAFLRYVTNEELDGGGEGINAYAIAVHALGRPASFDPQTDPVVRVFAGRLRSALKDYYEGPGHVDPVRITIPKGIYRPEFTRSPKAAPVVRTSRLGERIDAIRPGAELATFVALVLISASLIYFVPLARDWGGVATVDRSAHTRDAEISFPIVEIGVFDAGTNPSRQELLDGIRQQLVLNLSQFRSVRVRDTPANGDSRNVQRKSDFEVAGVLVEFGGSDVLEITVRRTGGQIIWNESVDIPDNDAQYQEPLRTTVHSIVPRVAGISGIVQNDAIRRWDERGAALGKTKTSDYECVVKFYVFGKRRTPESEIAATRCLEELTSQGSRDSMVWAYFSLVRFLEWVRQTETGTTAILEESLSAARRAIELDPANATAHEFAAMAYSAMGENETARVSFERALTLNPSKPDFYVHYGAFFIRLGEWERGVELVRQGIDLSPSPPGWMHIPLTLNAFRDGDYAEALRVAQVIIDTGDRRGYLPALAAAICLGDEDATVRYLGEFQKAYPGSVDTALNEIAKVYPDSELLAKYESALASVLTL